MYNLNENFTELAAQIASSTAIITEYLKKNGLPEPDFTVNSAGGLPPVPEVQEARMNLIDATSKLRHLALGSDELLRTESLLMHHDQSVIDILNQFDVWTAVPHHGTASVASIASKTGIPEEKLRRIFKHAFSMGLFAETSPGSWEIVHTGSSSYYYRNPLIKAWIGHNLEEVAPACTRLPDALRKYTDSQEPAHCAAGVAFFPDSPPDATLFSWFDIEREGEEKGWRVRRFGDAMASLAETGSARIEHVNAGFDWDSLGEATVVDIGGSLGHASIELASKHPKLKCIIQDFAELEPQSAALVPTELKSRVTFQAHNFFEPQPVVAEVYFLKHVCHDWSDKYVVKILKQIVPVMKTGSRVILMEFIVPARGAVPDSVGRFISAIDLQMMTLCNSKERTPEDWTKVVKETDERFDIKAFVQPPGSAAGLIEIVWKG
ncbi:putative O-methyltransferase [Mytilinidion resinicola]|uniref:O-methyltransferase n=1 Tax=Mytilinidion resinicola TaxID=574789 RepID=A0A6A6Z152_9PEZI|nr:putative O-methyltransferase [Mytilinidion resinicola]KAF2814831.1 putative O-methyltransferase [Mytilinidion resinicola]